MEPLRFAILHHDGIAEPHFDLLFETYPGSLLTTWRSEHWPIERPVALVRLREHRRHYLDYEGDIGGGRGRVTRVARGTCSIEVGEGAVWTVQLLTGTPLQTLVIRPRDAGHWECRLAGESRS